MVLRKLQQKDAEYMLEWMHDSNVYSFFGRNFSSMTIQDCQNFIENSLGHTEKSRNYAIVDENDEYMGTISLKNIEWKERRAEYAIACRTKAMGTGLSKAATEELFLLASRELNLQLIYLYVCASNIRAQRFYDKTGFRRVDKPDFIVDEMDDSLLWFQKEL